MTETEVGVCNLMHDLNSTLVDHPATGNEPDVTMKAGRQKGSVLLIERYNRHAQAILQRSKQYSENHLNIYSAKNSKIPKNAI